MYSKVITSLLLCSVVINGYLGLIYFDNSGEEVFDLNGDGDPEFRVKYEGAFERVEVDRNYDGRFDMISFYKGGFIAKSTSDDDFDGFFETKTSFEHGLPVVTMITSQNSDVYDITYWYENGVDSFVDVNLPYMKGVTREKLMFGLPESCFLRSMRSE